MSDNSSIEWTDATWNPTVGCSPVAKGCAHCYAEVMAWRHILMCRGLGRKCKYEGTVELGPNNQPRWTGVVRLDTDSLTTPLGWKKPKRIFADSMSDLFHEGLSFEEIAAVFGIMAACADRDMGHTFQVLTKRPERAVEFFRWLDGPSGVMGIAQSRRQTVMHESVKFQLGYDHRDRPAVNVRRGWPLPNVQIGTSIATQPDADKNIPYLSQIPAAVRFLSVEPLLGLVNIRQFLRRWLCVKCETPRYEAQLDLANVVCECGRGEGSWCVDNSGPNGIHWVIVGGKSGPQARPCNVEWIRSIVEQCKAAGVPVFVKQLGAKPYGPCSSAAQCGCDGGDDHKLNLRDRKGGDWLEWPMDLRVREFPEVPNV